MSMEEEHSDDTALAGEYVLHLLDADTLKTFEARLIDEPALRDLVQDWENQLSVLAEDIAPVIPPNSVKAHIQQTLFPDPEPVARSLYGWITGGLVAAGLIVAMVFYAPILGPQDVLIPSLTASVAAEDGSLLVTARFVTETNTLQIEREAGGALPGRVLELWLIAEGADAPVSLGILPDMSGSTFVLPDSLAVQMVGAVLAISDEPPGGSPTGTPTGAVLAVGEVTDT